MKKNINLGKASVISRVVFLMIITLMLNAGGTFAQWDGSTIESGTIYRSGSVAIGTASAVPDFELAVVGKILAREIVVQSTWPDFVFEEDYQLLPLTEVEKYVTENKHLPGIPAEAEVKENGVPVGEMQSKLLQKIEELTLYLIEENKQLENQYEMLRKLEEEAAKTEK